MSSSKSQSARTTRSSEALRASSAAPSNKAPPTPRKTAHVEGTVERAAPLPLQPGSALPKRGGVIQPAPKASRRTRDELDSDSGGGGSSASGSEAVDSGMDEFTLTSPSGESDAVGSDMSAPSPPPAQNQRQGFGKTPAAESAAPAPAKREGPRPVSIELQTATAEVVDQKELEELKSAVSYSRGSPTVTDAQSVLTGLDRDRLLLQADLLRQQAKREEDVVDQFAYALRQEREKGSSAETLRLKVRKEEAKNRALALHRRAERRYLAAHNIAKAGEEPAAQVIDIHGLKVREAHRQVERALADAILVKAPRLRIITGRGNHSKNGIPVLKESIIESMKDMGLPCEPNPKNPGELWVDIHSPSKPTDASKLSDSKKKA